MVVVSTLRLHDADVIKKGHKTLSLHPGSWKYQSHKWIGCWVTIASLEVQCDIEKWPVWSKKQRQFMGNGGSVTLKVDNEGKCQDSSFSAYSEWMSISVNNPLFLDATWVQLKRFFQVIGKDASPIQAKRPALSTLCTHAMRSVRSQLIFWYPLFF